MICRYSGRDLEECIQVDPPGREPGWTFVAPEDVREALHRLLVPRTHEHERLPAANRHPLYFVIGAEATHHAAYIALALGADDRGRPRIEARAGDRYLADIGIERLREWLGEIERAMRGE